MDKIEKKTIKNFNKNHTLNDRIERKKIKRYKKTPKCKKKKSREI
jgi:hypothetical protein